MVTSDVPAAAPVVDMAASSARAEQQNGQRSRLSLRQREALSGYLLISPWLVGFVALVLGPLLASFWLSFNEYTFVSPPRWAGLGNYARALKQELFWLSLQKTAIYTVAAVPLGVGGSLLCALLLNQKLPGTAIYRTLFYLPAVVSAVAMTLMWSAMLNPALGIVNYWLRSIGIAEPPKWFGDERWAMPALIAISTWGIGGPSCVMFLGALRGIPQELYEAARIDGASSLRLFGYITLPLLTPTIFMLTILGIIGTFAQGSFTMAYLATGGGPNYATYFYSLYLFWNAFSFMRMGFAAALAWLLCIVLVVITYLYFKLSSKWVYYAGEVS